MWLPLVMTSTPPARIACAVETVRPMPPATFSPLAVTKSMPRSSRNPGMTRSAVTRPGLPMRSPTISTRRMPAPGPGGRPPGPRSRDAARRLLRVLHGARLADDRHLDLAGIGQRLFDLAHDVARQAHRGQVVDLFGPDQDAHLPPGLHGERLLHALEAVGDGLQVFEALDVGVHR